MMHPSTTAEQCSHGIGCTSDKAGHAMSFMRVRLANNDRKGWVDARVIGFNGDWATLEDWFSERQYSVWSHEDLRVDLEVGDLVNVSLNFGVLALSERRISVALIQKEEADV